MIAEIARHDKSKYVRTAAVKKLTDQSLLAEITVCDEDEATRSTAAHRLTDEALLKSVLGKLREDNEFHLGAIIAILMKIGDEASLLEVITDRAERGVISSPVVEEAVLMLEKLPGKRDPVVIKLLLDTLGSVDIQFDY